MGREKSIVSMTMLILLLQLMLTMIVYKYVTIPYVRHGIWIGFIFLIISMFFMPPWIILIIMAIYFGWMLQSWRQISDSKKWSSMIQVGIIFVVCVLVGWIVPYNLGYLVEYLVIGLISIILIELGIMLGWIENNGLLKYGIVGLFTIWIVIDSNIMKRSRATWNTAIQLAINFYLDILNLGSGLVSN